MIINNPSYNLYKWLFIVVFWGMWLISPFLLAPNHAEINKFLWAIIPVNLAFIPLFFINSELLVLKLIPKKGVGYYVVSILLLMFGFMVMHYFLKSTVVDLPRRRFEFLGTIIPTLTITAVSTAYGLINLYILQDRDRQEEMLQRRQSELSFLRSQISPHFIFNALNSIVYFIRTKSPMAEEMTTKLSEIMQYTLYNTSDELVSLNKEINYLRNYIELQKVRFGSDVEVECNYNIENFDLEIEPMLFIPFVENAFKHGTGSVSEPFVHIDLISKDGEVELKVTNSRNAEAQLSSSAGIGLKNVERRLELLYPKKHKFEVKTEENLHSVYLKINLD